MLIKTTEGTKDCASWQAVPQRLEPWSGGKPLGFSPRRQVDYDERVMAMLSDRRSFVGKSQ
jgi:hypothetical protein